jgi:hypothetical protein
VGDEPVKDEGVCPEQMVCAPEMVLVASTGFTVMATVAEVSAHPPDATTRLYQLPEVSDGGE